MKHHKNLNLLEVQKQILNLEIILNEYEDDLMEIHSELEDLRDLEAELLDEIQ